MSDSQITIFYSWQSDLPGNETRNIIQDGIKEAVRLLRDTVDIEADRDTKGEYGSPDIANTIFSKIDECDIFVADVSAVCKYEVSDEEGNVKTKYMPNPNVMLELGYATHVVGWENVICVLNADYGAPEDMPFDIANRRLTPFSLKEGSSKGDAKRYVRDVIRETVEHILENGRRVKSGFSDIHLGSYVDGVVSDLVYPIDVSKSNSFVKHRAQIVAECFGLVDKIKSIKITEPSELQSAETQDNQEDARAGEATPIVREDGSVLTPITNSIKLNLFNLQRVLIKDEDKEEMIQLCKEYLGIDISKEIEFFDIGNLERKYDVLSSYSYEGTKEEECKFDSITMLDYNLHRIQMLDWYVTTFEGLFFIPIAIENVSTVYDENLDIHVKINQEDVDIIVPSKELINSDMKGLEGLIYEEGLIKELLLMTESSDISYDTDISYNLADSLAENQAAMKAHFNGAGINGNPRYDSDDYEREISKYIATPTVNGESEYVFSIASMRAKEKKWLGPALLIRPLVDSFNIEYNIKSKNSAGNLSGVITYNKK